MKIIKSIILSVIVFIVVGYVLNFMPVIKSSNCGCQSQEHYISLNYIFSCFCSSSNGDDFPSALKSSWIVYTLIIFPFVLAVFSFVYFKKRINK